MYKDLFNKLQYKTSSLSYQFYCDPVDIGVLASQNTIETTFRLIKEKIDALNDIYKNRNLSDKERNEILYTNNLLNLISTLFQGYIHTRIYLEKLESNLEYSINKIAPLESQIKNLEQKIISLEHRFLSSK